MGGVGGLTLVASLAAVLSHRTSSSRPPLSSRSTLPRLPSSSSACLALRPSSLAPAFSPGTAFRMPFRRVYAFSQVYRPPASLPVSNHRLRPWQSRRACCRPGAHRCCSLLRPAPHPHASHASSPPSAARRTSPPASLPTTLPLQLQPAVRHLRRLSFSCLFLPCPPRPPHSLAVCMWA